MNLWNGEDTWKALLDRFGRYEYPPNQDGKADSPALDEPDAVSRQCEHENIRS